jgi:O-antigen/teichoic acid export membrane protein
MSAARPGERNVQLAQGALLVAAAGGMVLSLALTVLLGRRLPSGEFGFFALVSTIFLIARSVIDMGSGNVVVRETAAGPTDERRAIEGLTGLRLVVSLPLALSCAGGALVQAPPSHAWALAAAAAVVPLTATSGLTVVFQLRQAQLAVATASLGAQLLALAACAALVLRGETSGWPFAAVVVAREVLVAAVTWRLAVGMLGYVPRPALDPAVLLRLGRLVGAYGAAALFFNLTFQCGVLLVRALRPAEELGAYAAALRLIGVLVPVPGVLLGPVVPVLAAAVREPAAFLRQSWGAAHLALGVGGLVAVGGWTMAPAVIELVYGGRFLQGGLSAVAAFRCMSLALGLVFVVEAAAITLLAERRERALVAVAAAMFAAQACAAVLLLPRVGFGGAAAAVALGAGLAAVAGLGLMRRAPGGAPLRRALLFLAPAAALAPILGRLPGPPVARLAIAAGLGLAALAVLLRLPGVAAYNGEQARLAGAAASGTPS